MKCLEFLYFYLMDETCPRSDLSMPAIDPSQLLDTPLSPSPFIDTPVKFQYFTQSGRNASSGSEDSFTSSDSSRSSSSSSSSRTSLTSLSSSSVTSKTPPSPTKPSSTHPYTRPRSLLMLQREVDFVPATPKKSHVSRLSVDALRPLSVPNSPFKNFRAVPDGNDKINFHESHGSSVGGEQNVAISKLGSEDTVKTTQQKKEFLGLMLGNVDALVEGVKRAGVWGLA